MKILSCLLVTFLLGGCAAWPTETKIEETSFMTLHAIDGLQTANIRGTPHCYEAESAWAMGREPSTGSTAAFFAVAAVAHFAVTDLLVNMHAKSWVIRAWELGSVAWDARDVANNAAIGIPVTR